MFFGYVAACGCHTGKIRVNNEDNLCFDGTCLELNNNGLPNILSVQNKCIHNVCGAIFDGMGGENFGEEASYEAAARFQHETAAWKKAGFLNKQRCLEELTASLNFAVVEKMRTRFTKHMGTTMLTVWFGLWNAYFCNVGDSRAYLLRNGALTQLSKDHVEVIPGRQKTPLTQHLGIAPDELRIVPHIIKKRMRRGDIYLLCSDGLTDMLTAEEIACILQQHDEISASVQRLIDAALEHGGRDNISVILYQIV